MKRERVVERGFAFLRWGGKRKGAGRKRRSERPSVPHDARPELAARHPVHVTLRLARGLPSLRVGRSYRVLEGAMRAGRERFGLRLVKYSVQSNHVHMLVEADGRESLSRGMQGLAIRMARALNRTWTRTGKVFADRYHAHVLGTPREVRNALAYVLGNARKHGVRLLEAIDPFSSVSLARTLELPNASAPRCLTPPSKLSPPRSVERSNSPHAPRLSRASCNEDSGASISVSLELDPTHIHWARPERTIRRIRRVTGTAGTTSTADPYRRLRSSPLTLRATLS